MSQLFRTHASNIIGAQISTSSGVFTTSNTAATDVTNLSVTITTIGRPVLIALMAGSSAAQIGLNNNSSASLNAQFHIVRDTVPSTGLVTVANYPLTSTFKASPAPDTFAPAASVWAVDFGVIGQPGTYLYKLQTNITIPGAGVARVENSILVAFQIDA